jgi:hypothetical protein
VKEERGCEKERRGKRILLQRTFLCWCLLNPARPWRQMVHCFHLFSRNGNFSNTAWKEERRDSKYSSTLPVLTYLNWCLQVIKFIIPLSNDFNLQETYEQNQRLVAKWEQNKGQWKPSRHPSYTLQACVFNRTVDSRYTGVCDSLRECCSANMVCKWCLHRAQ